LRDAVGKAMNAAGTAQNTGANLGGSAQGISANLTPFLTERMLHPEGYGQQDTSAQVAASTGAAGGATAGLTGQAIQRAAVSRNAGSVNATLADIARERAKAAAGSSEEIAAKNADLKQQQQQQAAEGLGNMYKTDTSGMLEAMGQVAPDINAATNASQSGWLQNSMNVLNSLNNAGNTAAGIKKAWG
jgi:hypothetical protein